MDQAMAFKRSALEVLERTGDANEVAKVCSSLGSDLTNEGLTEEAIKFLERSVELADSIGDLNTLGYALTNLAGSYIEVGNLDRAEANLDRAIQISQKLKERYIIATTHLYRGYLYHKRGEWEWAKDSYRTAIEELRAINAPTRLSYWLFEVAKVYVENADFEGALRYLNESYELALKNDQEKLRKQVEETIQGISI
jgi:tetratricopeptide (TPR) repeat protein